MDTQHNRDKLESNLNINIELTPTFSLASQQNAYPILKSIQISYPLDESELEQKPLAYRSLTLKLEGIDEWLEEESWYIDYLAPGESIRLPAKELSFPFNKLMEITEELKLSLSFVLLDEEQQELLSTQTKLNVLPNNYWGGEERQPSLLAAFVKPNGVYVESLVRNAALILEKSDHGRAIDGYQSNTREKPYLMLAALWNALVQEKIAYVNPPKGFAKTGQRIRLATDISQSKLTACLVQCFLQVVLKQWD